MHSPMHHYKGVHAKSHSFNSHHAMCILDKHQKRFRTKYESGLEWFSWFPELFLRSHLEHQTEWKSQRRMEFFMWLWWLCIRACQTPVWLFDRMALSGSWGLDFGGKSKSKSSSTIFIAFLLGDDQRLITLSIIIVSILGCGVIYYQSCFLEEYWST